jgi:hypothetical protein
MTSLDKMFNAIEKNPPYHIERTITPEQTTCFIMHNGNVVAAMSGPDYDAVTARASITCGRLNYRATGVVCSPVLEPTHTIPAWVMAVQVEVTA